MTRDEAMRSSAHAGEHGDPAMGWSGESGRVGHNHHRNLHKYSSGCVAVGSVGEK